MSIVTVIDRYDDVANTAFVNRLHDLSRRRAVVHAPASSHGLVNEVLRAVARHVPTAHDARPTVRRQWAATWIGAYDRLDLVIYGAWRLNAGDLRWLGSLVCASARRRLWLVAYEQADNRAKLSATADMVWTWEQFRDHWHPRIRNQRCRRRRHRLPHYHSALDVALDVPEARDPWPWAMPQLLLADGRSSELMRAASDITRAAKESGVHVLRLAQLVRHLFARWRTRPQRMFALTMLKNALFCEHQTWLDWEPRLVDVTVARPAGEAVMVWPSADPERAVDAILVANARQFPRGSSFEIARDGSHVTMETGETVAIAGRDRPALRARLALHGASGTVAQVPPRLRELPTRAQESDRGPDRQTLPQITRMIEIQRLRSRVGHNAPPLRLHSAVETRDRWAPAALDYQHGVMLSALLERLPPRRSQADVLRGDQNDDIRLLGDLQRYGLVAGYDGEPELASWLRSLWCNRRVVAV